ncbi:MAG: RNA polymerase sigma factor [Candidatus Riflebacteria bacterium]|nr:RNA polymerase sigma factor [Candidatus Riflebacteria bacterium]
MAISDQEKKSAEQDDFQIVIALQKGNKNLFRVLVQKYQARIEAFIDHFFNSDSHSQDVMQETFLTAYTNISQLKKPEKFRSWLFGIAYRKCHNIIRRNKVESKVMKQETYDLSQKEALSNFSDNEHLQESSENGLPCLKLLSQLSHLDGLLIWLHYIEDLPYREISELTEMPEPALRQRCARSLASLRKEMYHD